MCGENYDLIHPSTSAKGSPPRVRGKHWDKAWHGLKERITPACAGKTFKEVGACAGKKDHPRVCGENYGLQGSPWCQEGSPPRVRGKLLAWWTQDPNYRITPACAGKTPALRPLSAVQQDHPRVCGENREPGELFSAD